MIALLLAATLLVAFVNGANDNMKGVATLYGSGALSYRRALALATVSTALGSIASPLLASSLTTAFSAKGLVPPGALSTRFLAAVAVAAALTVLAATRLGLPVSTTHALIGGIAGAGLLAAGRDLDLARLGPAFLLPLLLGPLLAIPLAVALSRLMAFAGRRAGIESTSCICVGEEWVPVGSPAAVAVQRISAAVATEAECQQRYLGRVARIPAQAVVTVGHIVSAGLVGFARGLNDTPKMLGLLAGGAALSPGVGLAALTVVMALGGILAARRVATTLAQRVTPMTPGQGFAANLATSLLATGASRFGLPVSTTHVSAGGIFGIGAAGGTLRWRTVTAILGAWTTTLPLAALLGAGSMWLLG